MELALPPPPPYPHHPLTKQCQLPTQPLSHYSLCGTQIDTLPVPRFCVLILAFKCPEQKGTHLEIQFRILLIGGMAPPVMAEAWYGYISHLHGKCIFQSLVRTPPGILPASVEERCRPLYLCVQRPYLDIFKAPGSPSHELTSSDNSASMRI